MTVVARTADATTRSPRRAEMARAAARLFSARGYHGTSMRHLAGALGLLPGSLYAHIGSKQELLRDVVDDGARRFLARAEAAAALDAPAPARLEAFLVGHVETAIDHLDAATVFLNEWRYLDGPDRTAVAEQRDRYEAIVRAIVAGGIDEGSFAPDLDVAMAARLVLSAGNWVYTWYRPGGGMSPTEIGRTYARMITKGFAR